MPIQQIQIQGIRNLGQITLDDCATINVLTGLNGSGKTSLLEAIYLLGHGRSFRSARLNPVINHLESRCVVYGKIRQPNGELATAGISRSRGDIQTFKVNGMPATAASQLAEILPLQLIHAESFSLLEGGPKVRRQFLDWGVFHVEPSFLQLWRRTQKALKHRNALLRHGRINRSEMAPWEVELASCAEKIDVLRSRYINGLVPLFQAALEKLVTLDAVTLGYKRGWPDGSLQQSLLRDAGRDAQQGVTHSGPHRADLDIRVNGRPADEVLSRGQEKLLACALRLAQGALLHKITGKTCVYLVDDLPAELDVSKRQALCKELTRINSQVFVTATDAQSLEGCWSDSRSLRWFHVEHGHIEEYASPPGRLN
jgi:DNA replication and repair protein RecF